MRKVLRFSSLAFILLSAIAVHAQSTRGEIPFSGTATGQGAFGSSDLTFRLWNAATNGTYLNYADAQAAVPVNPDDSFSAVLGAGTGGEVPASLFAANPSMFIAVELTSTPGVEIGPRESIFSSGYAHFAQDADTLQGFGLSQVQLRVGDSCTVGNAIRVVNVDGSVTCQAVGTVNGSGTANVVPKFTGSSTIGNSAIFESGGNVGIGTASPANKLDVVSGGHISVGGSRVLNCTRSCAAIGSIPDGSNSLFSMGSVATPAGYSLTGCSAYWATSTACSVIAYPSAASISGLDDGAGACHSLGHNGSGGALVSCACVTACRLP